MKIKMIDLLNLYQTKKLKEGFKFIYDKDILECTNCRLLFAKEHEDFGNRYIIEKILDNEVIVLTPELILDDQDNVIQNDNTVKKEDIDTILSQTLIDIEKYGDKTTILKATLPNGFVIVESSSCVDHKNFDMSIGKQICMKKLEDKIWELEGYKLQSELSLN